MYQHQFVQWTDRSADFFFLKIENFDQNWNVSKRYLTRKHVPNPKMVHLIVLDALKSVIRSIQITVGINLQPRPRRERPLTAWHLFERSKSCDSSEVSDFYGNCDITFSRINLKQLIMSKTTQRWPGQLNLNKQKVLEWISNVFKTTIPVSISDHADKEI